MSFESVMPPYNASDPHARFLAASSLDFLLIELVPMAYRVTNQVDGDGDRDSTGADPEAPQPGLEKKQLDEEEERDAVFFRLESLGYRVGQGLVERFSRDRARFGDTLDVIKFVCKDLWTLVFRKQVDNLKTNHRVSFPFLLFSRRVFVGAEVWG